MTREVIEQLIYALKNHSGNCKLTDSECDIHLAALAAGEAAIAQPVQPTEQVGAKDAMAAEYSAWIDFYHAGNGSFDDFLKNRLGETK